MSGVEQDVPVAELKKLRQVAGWSGTTLELTIYNGTAWRITELYVRIQRYVGNEVVDDETPVTLVPPEEAVDAGVASLLSKVAPDRKKPGVNPQRHREVLRPGGPAAGRLPLRDRVGPGLPPR